MLQANIVTMSNGDMWIRLSDVKGTLVAWQKTIEVDEAQFLIMDLEETLRIIRQATPPRGDD